MNDSKQATCPNCGQQLGDAPPPEPPVGTWVRDRFGGATQRQSAGWGQPGMMPFGKWDAMWTHRGPLVECGPWGRPVEKAVERQGAEQ